MLTSTAVYTLDLVADVADQLSANIELRRQHLAAAVRLWPTDRLAASFHARRMIALKRREAQGGEA